MVKQLIMGEGKSFELVGQRDPCRPRWNRHHADATVPKSRDQRHKDLHQDSQRSHLVQRSWNRDQPNAPKDLCIVTFFRRTWANARDEEGPLKSQAGYIVMTSDRSHTLKRHAISTSSTEFQNIIESAAVAVAAMSSHEPTSKGKMNWETMIEPLEFGLVTDAKSAFDALTSPAGSTSHADKRTTIDLAIIREHLRRQNGCIRWANGKIQLANSRTKVMPSDVLLSVLRRRPYQLQSEFHSLNLRQQEKLDKQSRKASNFESSVTT